MSINLDNLNIGDKIPEVTFDPITQVQLIKYAGASGDFNPIHTVPEYAKEAGLDGTIAHGMLIMGMLGKMITDWADLRQIVKYGVSFKSKTLPSDILTAKGEVKKITNKDDGTFVDCNVYIQDQNDDVKVEGKLTIKF